MPLIEHDDVIKALTTNRADQALGVSLLPRGARCRQHFLDSQIGNPRANDISVDIHRTDGLRTRHPLWPTGQSVNAEPGRTNGLFFRSF